MDTRSLALAFVLGCTGVGALAFSGVAAPAIGPEKYVCYVILAIVSATLRITRSNLPGGTSMAFLFVLVSLMELNALETLVLSSVAVLIVSIPAIIQRTAAAR